MGLIQSKKNQAIGAKAGWTWEWRNTVGDTFEKYDKHTWQIRSGIATGYSYGAWVVVDLIEDRYQNHRLYKTLEEALADEGGVPYKKWTGPDWATLYKKG